MAAFLPLGWQYPGYALVVTKRPVRDVYELTEANVYQTGWDWPIANWKLPGAEQA